MLVSTNTLPATMFGYGSAPGSPSGGTNEGSRGDNVAPITYTSPGFRTSGVTLAYLYCPFGDVSLIVKTLWSPVFTLSYLTYWLLSKAAAAKRRAQPGAKQ